MSQLAAKNSKWTLTVALAPPQLLADFMEAYARNDQTTSYLLEAKKYSLIIVVLEKFLSRTLLPIQFSLRKMVQYILATLCDSSDL